MQAHIGGIVLVEPVVHARGHIAQRVSGTDGLPGCSRSPPVTLGRTELERAVLHQFRIESAIGSTTDILEEDTDQFVTNSLSPGRRVHGFLGRHAQSGCHHDTQNDLSFHQINLFLFNNLLLWYKDINKISNHRILFLQMQQERNYLTFQQKANKLSIGNKKDKTFGFSLTKS